MWMDLSSTISHLADFLKKLLFLINTNQTKRFFMLKRDSIQDNIITDLTLPKYWHGYLCNYNSILFSFYIHYEYNNCLIKINSSGTNCSLCYFWSVIPTVTMSTMLLSCDFEESITDTLLKCCIKQVMPENLSLFNFVLY